VQRSTDQLERFPARSRARADRQTVRPLGALYVDDVATIADFHNEYGLREPFHAAARTRTSNDFTPEPRSVALHATGTLVDATTDRDAGGAVIATPAGAVRSAGAIAGASAVAPGAARTAPGTVSAWAAGRLRPSSAVPAGSKSAIETNAAGALRVVRMTSPRIAGSCPPIVSAGRYGRIRGNT
jgi:hypothetical protein